MNSSISLLSKIFGAALFFVLVIVVAVDFNKLKEVLTQANYWYLFFSLLLTFVSVSVAAIGYVISANIFKINASFRKKFLAGWLGVAVNDLIMSGGVVGYGIRVKILRSPIVKGKQVISASLFYSYVFLFFMALALPGALFYFYTYDIHFSLLVKKLILGGAALSFSLVIVMSLLLFLSRLRMIFFKISSKIIMKFFKKNLLEHLTEVDKIFSQSLTKKNAFNIGMLFIAITCSWLLFTTTLHLTFLAVGVSVPILYLFCAIVVSVVIGYLSVLPGGLGSQDLSLTGILVLGGYDLQAVILAAILFRLVYYIIPFALASIHFNFKLLRKNSYID